LQEGIIILNRTDRIIDLNKESEKITRYKKEELIGQSIVKILPEFPNILTNIGVYSPVKLLKKDHTETAVFISLTKLDVNKKSYVKILNFKEMENCLECIRLYEKEHQKCSAIFESVADGVFTVDDQLKITSFNSSAEKITGYNRKEVIGKKCFEIFKNSNCEELCKLQKNLKKGTMVKNIEVLIRTKNNILLPVSINTAILQLKGFGKIGCVISMRDISSIKRLTKEISEKYRFGNFISRSREMQLIYGKLESFADSNLNILIEGETGTGKDLLARSIHFNSSRKNKPFVKVTCAAIPETLLESELFGYEKGAFTGAVRDKPGRFELANGGTLFLNEVGDIPTHLQVKLLRAIEEGEFERLGGKSSVKVDVRIIAATNKDLYEEVAKGTFRKDLFFRLNIVNLKIPPLRKRREDIPTLVDHFIQINNKKMGKEIIGISNEALHILYVFAQKKFGIIEKMDLPDHLNNKFGQSSLGSLKESEKKLLLEALRVTQNNKNETAKILGISRTTLWRKLKKLDIYV